MEFTELGNPNYAETDLAIECKKLYAQQFDADLLPAKQRERLSFYYFFIGRNHSFGHL